MPIIIEKKNVIPETTVPDITQAEINRIPIALNSLQVVLVL